MTETEDLLRDIDNLREAIRRHWISIEPLALTDKEQGAVRLRIALCLDELVALLKRMSEAEIANRS